MIFNILDNSKLILAISGGPDSVYLLYKLLKIQKKKNLSFHIAHLNHNTRGKESNLDQKFVENLAKKHNTPTTLHKLFTTDNQSPSEDHLRKKRYSFLKKVLKEQKADYIVTAHHQDDQVETILFNFFRGTGPTGLLGMQYQQGKIIRPLLNISKTDILSFLQKNKIKFRTDKSNQDTKFKRNLIRNKILPLVKEINSNPSNSIINLKNILESQQDYINKQTFLKFKNIFLNSQIPLKNWKLIIENLMEIENCKLEISKPTITLSLPKFKSLHPVIQSEIIKIIINPLVPNNKQLTSKSINEVVEIINHSQGGSQKILFNTLSISKKNDKIYLRILHKKTK